MFEYNTHLKLLSFSKLSMNDASALESVTDFLMADLNGINFKIEFMLEVHLEKWEQRAQQMLEVKLCEGMAKGAVGY